MVAKKPLKALVANKKGEIFDLPDYAAVGMAADKLITLSPKATKNMPHGGELMYLPDRHPILFDLKANRYEVLSRNPDRPDEPIFPVAAFNSPGFVNTYVSAYREEPEADFLPLFSYGAVGWQAGKFRSAVVRVDRQRRQDLRLMPYDRIIDGINDMQKKLPKNRLRAHLENCALVYGCPAAKNFFLGRSEAPIPTSRRCNAQCRGCLSLQTNNNIPVSQQRIKFTPSPAEIADLALTHLDRVKQGIISFGQGCEGDPLLAYRVIHPAIQIIRSTTTRGTINMNTNGSKPDLVAKLLGAGLDSVRISLNSVRPDCYEAYFQPKDYRFRHVLKSIEYAINKGKYISVNYLNCPGFTDTPAEYDALKSFLTQLPINMIQWRNLNFDPQRYWNLMQTVTTPTNPIGMITLLDRVRKAFPTLKFGYFNPPKEKFHII